MNFKDITAKDKKEIKAIYSNKDISWDNRMKALMDYFGKSERTVRKWLVALGIKEKADKEISVLKIAKTKQHDKKYKRFLITAAQNATPTHQGFLKNLEAYAKHIEAEILVIPFRYHNPTSIFTVKDETQEWWDNSVLKYLTLNRHDLNNSISVLSDVKIQPTAKNPLDGLESITGDHSSIIGHPRVHLKTLPVLDGMKHKILLSTGACTKKNYIESKAGKIGEFHHSYGACIVELKDEETFYTRQIKAKDNGDFIDLFYKVSGEQVTKIDKVEALVMGDIHLAEVDKNIVDVTLNDLCKKLYPQKLFLHDIIDSRSISHHDLKDPFLLYEKEISGKNLLQKEIDEMIEWLEQVKQYNVYIVKSNHDEHIDRFLAETDWRKMSTLKNALPYMELSMAKLKGEAGNGAIPYIINKKYPKIKCLGYNDSCKVKGFELSVHGHIGASGSRGSLPQYRRLNTRIITGHSHQPMLLDGAMSVGTTSKLRLSYNKGASAWLNCHAIINEFGKAQHIIFIKDKEGKVGYTTFR
jgi:hypothetical protein